MGAGVLSGASHPGSAFAVRVKGPSADSVTSPSVSFRATSGNTVASSGTRQALVTGYVLDGRGSPAERVLGAFAAGGIEGVTALDGSFAAVIADHATGQAWAVTDVVSSRALYLWEEDGAVVVTNDLASGPTSKHALDPAGIASYLASDGTHGGLTPYRGVTALNPGSITDLVPGNVKSFRYWRINPEPVRRVEEYDALLEEMAALMRRSVARRLEAAGGLDVRISLSGGIDSKGLLGMLLEHVSPGDITALTYYRGEQIGDMDLPEAQRVAAATGLDHRPIVGYEGNFLQLVAYNALRGEGVAHFCDEGDVWRSLEGSGDNAVMVTGDRQAHHLSSIADLSARQVLRMVSVFPPEAVEWFYARLDPDVASALAEGWGSRFEEIAREYGNLGPWHQFVHPAYIEERSSRTLALWRERFSSTAGTVLNPYLDRDLLDFVASLPDDLNDVEGRFLHREAILAHWPHTSVGIAAHGGWNAPSWATEIQRHAPGLRQMVHEVDSRLEELIPKSVILDLVNEVEGRGSGLTQASDGLGWQLRKAVKRSKVLTEATRKMKGRRKLATPPTIDAATITRELLTLHLALADRAQVASLVSKPAGGLGLIVA